MTEISQDMLRRTRRYAATIYWILGGAFLVSMAFATESLTGVGHHLMLIAGGIAFGIGASRRR